MAILFGRLSLIPTVTANGLPAMEKSSSRIPFWMRGHTKGTQSKHHKSFGLQQLDPAPHFDLVIIDEAHHLRNGSMEKDKAFAYKCVHYFCQHADAVVMLTATPLQTSDDDLYTLLNLLQPRMS